jgi:hypothetical protein
LAENLLKLVFVSIDLHDGVVKAGSEATGLVADVEVRPSLHQHPANHVYTFFILSVSVADP